MTADAIAVDEALLRRWPLPQPDRDGDKAARGRALVIAGSRDVPGAALLAGVAALRAGAGKLMLASGASLSSGLGLALPEARVLALAEDVDGAWLPTEGERIAQVAANIDAVLIGPGLIDAASSVRFVRAVLPALRDKPVILDASAMDAATRFDQPLLLTPHAGEMAKLMGEARAAVERDPADVAVRAAQRWNAVVALKGPVTFIATPPGRVWRHDGGDIALATSGSGDVLAGLIVGLTARGAALDQAAVWGVALHGMAGVAMARRIGRLGALARELAQEVPALMQALSLHS